LEIKRSALIAYPAEYTFDLIEGAEHYPDFLPWCSSAVILARDEAIVAARIGIAFHGLRFDLTTRNLKRRPEWMAIRMERGPFRRFEGEWHITPLGSAACKIELALRYEFDNALGRLAGKVFDGFADTIVDAFARRAEEERDRARAAEPNPKAFKAQA